MSVPLSDSQVADVLVVLGAIARLVDEDTSDQQRLQNIRQALATIGVGGQQTRAERLASIRRTCRPAVATVERTIEEAQRGR